MTLTADSNGVILGKFTAPSVNPATKKLIFTGGSGSVANALFFANGVFGEVANQVTVNDLLEPVIDSDLHEVVPIFQIFSLPADIDVGALALYVVNNGTTYITAQVRTVVDGKPSSASICTSTVKASLITDNTWYDFALDTPINFKANTDYALCIFSSDATAEIGTLDIGGTGLADSKMATNTSLYIKDFGAAVSSTDYQLYKNKQLCFRVKKAVYTESSHTIALGSVSVSDISRLCVFSPSNKSINGVALDKVILTLPDDSTLEAVDGQVIKLDASITGDIELSKQVFSTGNLGNKAVGGTQLLVGDVVDVANYISLPMVSEVGSKIKISVDAHLPSGSSITLYVSPTSSISWTTVSGSGSPIALGGSVYRYTFLSSALAATEVLFRLRLSGAANAVPMVYGVSAETGYFDSAHDLVTAEALSRDDADNALSDMLTDEITAREDADNALSDMLTDEITAREDADDALLDEINNKADKNGNTGEIFSADDGTSGKEVVNFDQLNAAELRILERAWPIGSVYENEVDLRNPNHPDLLGFGTWFPTQEGLVSVGYHLGDLDFGTLNQVGGNRAIDMSLTVGLTAGTGLYVIDDVVTTPSMGVFSDFINSGDAADTNDIALRFKLDASGSSNLPPYTVSKKWRRTA